MTHATRSMLNMLNDRTTEGFYLTIVCACLAFAGMLVSPHPQAEWMLALAWLFMLCSIVCLAGKLALELVEEQAG